MIFSKTINQIRRNITQKLTKNIGNSNLNFTSNPKKKPNINTILIIRPNKRLGNLLLITALIQDVINTFPDCKIDLLVKGNVAPAIFKNYENINEIIQVPNKPLQQIIKYINSWLALRKKNYDIVINVDKNSSSGRLATKFSNANYKFFGDFEDEVQLKNNHYKHIAKYPIFSFRNHLKQLGFPDKNNPIPSLNLNLSPLEIEEGNNILKKLFANEGKTICIFTFATGEKCLSESWWEECYQKLKTTFPNYNIVEVLPYENISKIDFKAPTFYSKSIREIGSFIANTAFFIGADSGIMHLASAAQTPTLGLFSVSDFYLNKYKPYNNNSLAINTNEKSIDDIMEFVNNILNQNLN